MEIIKKDKNSLEFSHDDSRITLNTDAEGYSTVVVKREGGDVYLERPGEYEYSGVYITALEVPAEKMVGKIDLVVIGLENNIDIMFALKDVDINESIKEKVKGLNVYVTNIANIAKIKNATKLFQPERVVLLENFGSDNSKEIESIKSELPKVEKVEAKKLKFKEEEFNTEEDLIQLVFIL